MSEQLINRLGLRKISGYNFKKVLGGGSALTCLYAKGDHKVVYKFLIAPRNKLERDRFYLEYMFLEKNLINGLGEFQRFGLPFSPDESYPIPVIASKISCKNSQSVHYFSYEYEEGVLLSDLDTQNMCLSEKIYLLHRVSSALSYFSRGGYAHRDLHPENILIMPNPDMDTDREQPSPRVKILDVGQAKSERSWYKYYEYDVNLESIELDDQRRLMSSFRSMPPDFLEEGGAVENYDCWSFGIFSYRLLFNSDPFDLKTITCVNKLLGARAHPLFYDENLQGQPYALKAIILKMLNVRGKDRVGLGYIVKFFHFLRSDDARIKDPGYVDRIISAWGLDPDDDPLNRIY